MAASGEDLDLLLSLRSDRVLETPPASPSSIDGSPRRKSKKVDMSVFRDAVKDYMDEEPASSSVPVTGSNGTKPKSSKGRKQEEVIVEKFSGLRIRNLTMSPVEINNHFSDIRFIRLSALKNLGDNTSGSWATAGVLLEKGANRVSSAGKNYGIWKFGSLEESGFEIPVFLFNDSHLNFSNDSVGTVFALFNANVKRDNSGKGFVLSIYSANQMIKMGISADFAICKGKRKDGLSCTMTINKNKGAYCKFHTSNTSQKYTTGRAELKGGNLYTAFRPKNEGIFMVDPFSNKNNFKNSTQPVKVMSVDALKKALSKADKTTSNKHSQGIRFLSHVTTEFEIPTKNIPKPEPTNHNSDKSRTEPKIPTKNVTKPKPTDHNYDQRAASKITKIGVKRASLPNKEPEPKREKINKIPEKTIELDFVSSDED
ncbi:hypothetical protein LUZ60_011905 [Juncus effusus]|nr:hypothetical protein LUZ60_011905 [Juncus effusus]